MDLLIIYVFKAEINSELDMDKPSKENQTISPLKCYCFLTIMTKALIKESSCSGCECRMLEFKLKQLIKEELNECGRDDRMAKLACYLIRIANSISSSQ